MGLPSFFERKLFFVFGRHIWNIVGVGGFIALLAGIIVFGDSFIAENIKSRRQYFGRNYPVLKSKEKYFGKEYPTLKIKNEYFGRNYVKLKTKNEYFGKDLLTDRKIKKIVVDSKKVKTYKTWLNENEGSDKKFGYKSYSNFLITVPPNANLNNLNSLYENYKRETYDSYLLNNIPKDLIEKQKKQEKSYKSYKLSLSNKLRTQDTKYNQYFQNITSQQNLLNTRYENYKDSINQKQNALENEYKKYKNEKNYANSLLPIQRLTAAFVMAWGLGVVSFSSLISTVFSIERNTRKEE